MNSIYIVYAIKARKNTVDDLIKDMVVEKIRGTGKDVTLDAYKRKLLHCGELYYWASAEPIGYFLDFGDARYVLEKNDEDINSSGRYPCAAIAEVRAGEMYSDTCIQGEDVVVFKYDKDRDCYEQMKNKNSYLYMRILLEITKEASEKTIPDWGLAAETFLQKGK